VKIRSTFTTVLTWLKCRGLVWAANTLVVVGIFTRYLHSPQTTSSTSVVGPRWFQCVSGSRDLKKFFLFFYFIAEQIYFLKKNCNLFIHRPPRRTAKLQEMHSALKKEHHNIKFFIYFCCCHFLPSRIRIWIQPNKINVDPGRSGSTTL
jgi:hypothetical protein